MLWKKLFRDLWANKVSNLAVIVVIAIGIMSYSSFSIAMDTLEISKDVFYEQGSFPDAYFDLVAAPLSSVDSVRQLQGVAQAEGRTVIDVRIDDDFGAPSEDTKYIRLTSHTDQIGKYLLLEGTDPQEGFDQIVISKSFADANHLSIGDTIPVICSGSKNELIICGICQVPEYIYALRTGAQIFPDPLNFSIGFMHTSSIKRITGKNSFSQIIYTIHSGYDQQAVEKNMDALLKNYGVIKAYSRDDQLSNMLFTQELLQIRGTVIVMPMIFLSVSSMILFIMIGRIVEKQRGQIGLLKAFGLADRKIFLHYISYSVIISSLGGILGVIAGYFLSKPILFLYGKFFEMPFVSTKTTFNYAIIGVSLTIIAGAIAGLKSSITASQLHPSEAMRSKTPDIVRSGWLERSHLIMSLFTTTGKMSLRNLFRNPSRSLFILIGIMFTFAFAVVPWNSIRLSDRILLSHYNEVEKYNARIYLSRFERLSKIKNELLSYNDIQIVEGCLDIPATLINAHLQENISIIGIESNSRLFTLSNDQGIVHPSYNELLLSSRLANKLQVKKGDIIQVRSPLFSDKDEKIDFIIRDTVDQTVGMSAYADIIYLGEQVGDSDIANSILIRSYEKDAEHLKEIYHDSSMIDGINSIQAVISKMNKFLETYKASVSTLIIISIAMGFAIIYNSYAIILSEREKEFASLLVMGMSEKEVIGIVKLEQWLITLIAIPLGVPLTSAMVKAIGVASSNDMFSLDFEVDHISFIIGGSITLLIIALAQFSASQKIQNLKLSDALKADE